MQLKNRVGEKYITNKGYEVEVIEYFGALNCTIKFNTEEKVILKNQQISNILKGQAVNPYHKLLCGVGYYGEGTYKPCGNGTNNYYYTWRSMLKRCYDKKQQEKQPTYIGCSVDERWHNFQNFAKWFEDNYTEGWHLDKDILVKGNKIYSPETCCFVPREINALFIRSEKTRGKYPIGVTLRKSRFRASMATKGKKTFGLGHFETEKEAFECYKLHKEAYIKEVADKWKSQITEKVYQALIDYQVEITD